MKNRIEFSFFFFSKIKTISGYASFYSPWNIKKDEIAVLKNLFRDENLKKEKNKREKIIPIIGKKATVGTDGSCWIFVHTCKVSWNCCNAYVIRDTGTAQFVELNNWVRYFALLISESRNLAVRNDTELLQWNVVSGKLRFRAYKFLSLN